MLTKEAISNPNAVEEILKEMKQAYVKEKVPMDNEQSIATMSIMLATEAAIDIAYEKLKQSWQAAGFFKRCEIFPIKYEKRLLLWLAAMYNEFGIGGMILIAYYVQFRAKEIYVSDTLMLSQTVEYIFPNGVFKKSTVHEFWDKQKVAVDYPDNIIDYPAACASFMKIDRTEPVTHKDH